MGSGGVAYDTEGYVAVSLGDHGTGGETALRVQAGQCPLLDAPLELRLTSACVAEARSLSKTHPAVVHRACRC